MAGPARIKTNTVYHALQLLTSPTTAFPGGTTTVSGSFVLKRIFRFGDSLMVYHDDATGKIYPINSIVATASPAGNG